MTKFRISIFFIIVLISQASYSQVIDDFSDGDFTNNPNWSATPSAWTVTNQVLRSAPTFSGSSPFFISTPSTITSGIWRAYFRYASLIPTSGNHAEFWVMADQQDLSQATNGYFIRIGDTDKDICLYRYQNGTSTKIIDGPNQIIASNSNSGFVRLTRTTQGQFALWAININNGADSVLMGTVTDAEINASTHLGILVKSTPSNYGRHYFDDFNCLGPAFPDQIPPSLLSATLASPNEIDLNFDEPLDESFSETIAHYSLNPAITILSAILNPGDPNQVRLTLSQSFSPGLPYTVSILQSKDLMGNIRTEMQSRILTYQPGAPYRTLVINEIMANPNSNAGTTVPQVEWIELHNPGTGPVTMNGWTIRDASNLAPKLIPLQTIPAGGYLILTSLANVPLFPGLQVAGMPIPTLNNDYDSLVLADPFGNPVDVVAYKDTWYRDAEKKLGGYSLEMIQPKIKCTVKENWIGAAFPEGGSPGEQNTVYSPIVDNQGPILQSVSFPSASEIAVKFAEGLDPLFSSITSWYSLQPGNISITSASLAPNDSSKVILLLATALQTGVDYTLSISQAKDRFCNIELNQQINFQYSPVATLPMENEKKGWDLLPNPSTGTVKVSAGNLLEMSDSGRLVLTNLMGQSQTYLISSPDYILDLTALPSGIYAWKMLNNNQEMKGNGKLILKK